MDWTAGARTPWTAADGATFNHGEPSGRNRLTKPVVTPSNVAGARSRLVTSTTLTTCPVMDRVSDWMFKAGSTWFRTALSDQPVRRVGNVVDWVRVGMCHRIVTATTSQKRRWEQGRRHEKTAPYLIVWEGIGARCG